MPDTSTDIFIRGEYADRVFFRGEEIGEIFRDGEVLWKLTGGEPEYICNVMLQGFGTCKLVYKNGVIYVWLKNIQPNRMILVKIFVDEKDYTFKDLGYFYENCNGTVLPNGSFIISANSVLPELFDENLEKNLEFRLTSNYGELTKCIPENLTASVISDGVYLVENFENVETDEYYIVPSSGVSSNIYRTKYAVYHNGTLHFELIKQYQGTGYIKICAACIYEDHILAIKQKYGGYSDDGFYLSLYDYDPEGHALVFVRDIIKLGDFTGTYFYTSHDHSSMSVSDNVVVFISHTYYSSRTKKTFGVVDISAPDSPILYRPSFLYKCNSILKFTSIRHKYRLILDAADDLMIYESSNLSAWTMVFQYNQEFGNDYGKDGPACISGNMIYYRGDFSKFYSYELP